MNTLVEVIKNVRKDKEKGITFINSEIEDEFPSYSDLYKKSLKLLKALQQYGVQSNNELLFQIDDNELSLVVLWGCILGRIIPVPVTVSDNHEHQLKVFNVWKLLGNPFLIVNKNNFERLESNFKTEVSKIADNTILIEDAIEKAKGCG